VSKPNVKNVKNAAKIESLAPGHFAVAGVLDASTVTDLLEQSRDWFDGPQRVEVDLAGVSESDSSGLALVIEWLRLARLAGKKIHFANLPEQMMALARISEVDDLLTANGSEVPASPVVDSAPAAHHA